MSSSSSPPTHFCFLFPVLFFLLLFHSPFSSYSSSCSLLSALLHLHLHLPTSFFFSLCFHSHFSFLYHSPSSSCSLLSPLLLHIPICILLFLFSCPLLPYHFLLIAFPPFFPYLFPPTSFYFSFKSFFFFLISLFPSYFCSSPLLCPLSLYPVLHSILFSCSSSYFSCPFPLPFYFPAFLFSFYIFLISLLHFHLPTSFFFSLCFPSYFSFLFHSPSSSHSCSSSLLSSIYLHVPFCNSLLLFCPSILPNLSLPFFVMSLFVVTYLFLLCPLIFLFLLLPFFPPPLYFSNSSSIHPLSFPIFMHPHYSSHSSSLFLHFFLFHSSWFSPLTSCVYFLSVITSSLPFCLLSTSSFRFMFPPACSSFSLLLFLPHSLIFLPSPRPLLPSLSSFTASSPQR